MSRPSNNLDIEDDIAIVKSAYFDISMMRMSLAVLSIPHRAIPKCAWWLFREYGNCNPSEAETKNFPSDQKGFGCMLVDDDGLSLICNEKEVIALRHLLKPENFTLSPFFWKAFVIRVGGSAIEVPGVVYSLANALSDRGLSILHISTFESEIFLIQETDLETACRILKEFEDPARIQEMFDQLYQHHSSGRERLSSVDNLPISEPTSSHAISNKSEAAEPRVPASGSRVKFETDLENSQDYDAAPNPKEENEKSFLARDGVELERMSSIDNEDEDGFNLDLSWITPQVKSTISLQTRLYSESHLSSALPSRTKFDEGFTLCVLPTSTVIAKCPRSQMKVCSDIMVKLLLFDERYSKLSPLFSRNLSFEQLVAEEQAQEKLQQAQQQSAATIGSSSLSRNDQSEYFLPTDDPLETPSLHGNNLHKFYHKGEQSASNEESPLPPTGKTLPKSGKAAPAETDRANYLWGVWFYNDEATFLINENDLPSFPLDSLILSPQQWKVIKLCGRPIAFNETGVVSAMSQIDLNVPALNISTAITNCTLVPYELLSATADGLSRALNCPVQYSPSPC